MDNGSFLFGLFLGLLLCGWLGALVAGANKGLGFVLGVLLGPIGIIVAAILGNRSTSSNPNAPPAGYTPSYTPVPSASRSHLDEAPDQLTVRRKGEVLGTWPLADALEYLADGRLLPTDHYQTAAGNWSLMKHLQS